MPLVEQRQKQKGKNKMTQELAQVNDAEIIDHQIGELIPYEPLQMTVARPPEVVLEEARKAARALSDVIANKKKPVIFNGEQYLEFEDWMTVGRFYGVSAKITRTTYVEFGEVKGFEAFAEVIDGNGRVVSSAEAMCLNDENNWSKKPLFQLRSMAQTRACSKAFRNALAWVVVLAGYKPTPAEEMQDVKPQYQQPARAAAPATGVISEAQGKRLYAIAKGAGIPDEEMKAFLSEEYGLASSRDIQRVDYDTIVAWAQAQGGK